MKVYVRDQYALDLLDKLLTMNPRERIDADAALSHDFFWNDPMPCDLSKMLSQHTTSMFEYLAPPVDKVLLVLMVASNSQDNNQLPISILKEYSRNKLLFSLYDILCIQDKLTPGYNVQITPTKTMVVKRW